ncbi:MAG: hypothetical protein KUG73_12970 [Pseudomonadales bacterium]|nr:hypothetical protein [Pseudomonadales bacterium]
MVRRQLQNIRCDGFSLLLLSVWMIGLSLAVAVLLALQPNRLEQIRIDKTIRTMEDAQGNVLAFVVENYRLPVADTDVPAAGTYGFENAAANSGALPFRTMELPVPVLDQASLPLRYTPYRNSGDDADLASATSLYTPALPDLDLYDKDGTDGSDFSCDDPPTSPINLLDFCIALENAEALAPDADYANTGPGVVNAAYVLASGGLEDADGDGADSSLDGANDDGDVSFEDPARGREKGYDDIVRVITYAALHRELSCNALIGSLDLLVATADDAANLANNTEVAQFQAEVAVAFEAFGLVINGIILANAVVSATAASAEAVQACINAVASLGVLSAGCVAATATAVSAGIAAVAAAIDLALSIASLGTAIALLVETTRLNGATHQHTCDIFDDVINADARGGLL